MMLAERYPGLAPFVNDVLVEAFWRACDSRTTYVSPHVDLRDWLYSVINNVAGDIWFIVQRSPGKLREVKLR